MSRPCDTRAKPKEDVGIVAWRVCFYVAGDLSNFMYLLDDFWNHLADKMATEKKFDVELSTASNVNVDDTWENLSFPNYTLNEPSDKLSVSVFEAPPCFGKRPAAFAIEVLDASTISVVISQVYNFRDRFEEMGTLGQMCFAVCIEGGGVPIPPRPPRVFKVYSFFYRFGGGGVTLF